MKISFAMPIAAITVVLLPTQAMAAKRYLDVQAIEPQRARMDRGLEAVDSNLPFTSVRITEDGEKVKKRGTILVTVLNAGFAPFNFGPENVSIETADGLAASVIPYEKLVKEEKNRQMWAAIAAGFGNAANSYNAAQAGYSHGTATAYNNYGGRAWGTYSNYNAGQAYAAQSIANMENQANLDRLASHGKQSLEALKANMRTTTVDPGQSFGGQVTYELPKEARSSKGPVNLIITIQAGEENHTFVAQVTRR